MNANELADKLDSAEQTFIENASYTGAKYKKGETMQGQAATMLRQLQTENEALKAHPADLTDEEIVKLHEETSFFGVLDPVKFARAILRKAQQ